MPEAVQRMLPLATGKRTAIRLDAASWQAIDWLASQANQTWQAWCNAALTTYEEGDNLTATLRTAAMNGILVETILATPPSLEALADNHELLRYSAVMNDKELRDHMKGCEVLGHENYGSFTLHAGKDEFGRPCVWIENNMKGCASVVIPFEVNQ